MAEEGRQIIYNMVKVGKTLPSGKKILNDIYLGFYYGAKIGILGLNGSGKSTLMRIIAGKDKDFDGEVHLSPGYTVGFLEQEPDLDESKTVIEIVREGVQPIMEDGQAHRPPRCSSGPDRSCRSMGDRPEAGHRDGCTALP